MTIQSLLRSSLIQLRWVLDRRRAAASCRWAADDLADLDTTIRRLGRDERHSARTEARMPETDWRICGRRKASRRR